MIDISRERSTRPLPDAAQRALAEAVGRDAPAITYGFVHADGAIATFASGRGDVADDAVIDPAEPLPLYSMTKAITALATLELLRRRGLGVETEVRELVPSFPFREYPVRVVDLLAHTAGLPNPFPLRWVHRPEQHADFAEAAARANISKSLRARPPNTHFRYSNVGYWWLGPVVESLCGGKPFVEALAELGLPSRTRYPESARALGHVRRFGMLRAVGALVLDPWVFAGAQGRWMRIARHHVDGVAYGGLLGSVLELTSFLERLLAAARGASGESLRQAVVEPRRLANGRPLPMTAALHVGRGFLFKEGGGAGFHSELRLHVDRGCASVVIANSSEIDVKRLLTEIDTAMLDQR